MNFWTLHMTGFAGVGLSEGLVVIMVRHLPQLRVLR